MISALECTACRTWEGAQTSEGAVVCGSGTDAEHSHSTAQGTQHLHKMSAGMGTSLWRTTEVWPVCTREAREKENHSGWSHTEGQNHIVLTSCCELCM